MKLWQYKTYAWIPWSVMRFEKDYCSLLKAVDLLRKYTIRRIEIRAMWHYSHVATFNFQKIKLRIGNVSRLHTSLINLKTKRTPRLWHHRICNGWWFPHERHNGTYSRLLKYLTSQEPTMKKKTCHTTDHTICLKFLPDEYEVRLNRRSPFRKTC